MVINTTFHVEPSVESEFIVWMHSDYLPEATAAGCLHTPLFLRIMTPMEGGTGYAVQLHAPSQPHADEWLERRQPRLLADMARRWGTKVMYFTTLMEEVAK